MGFTRSEQWLGRNFFKLKDRTLLGWAFETLKNAIWMRREYNIWIKNDQALFNWKLKKNLVQVLFFGKKIIKTFNYYQYDLILPMNRPPCISRTLKAKPNIKWIVILLFKNTKHSLIDKALKDVKYIKHSSFNFLPVLSLFVILSFTLHFLPDKDPS